MLFLLSCVIKVEPYWNVKMGESVNPDGTLSIKVEPYWNVKTSLIRILAKLVD